MSLDNVAGSHDTYTILLGFTSNTLDNAFLDNPLLGGSTTTNSIFSYLSITLLISFCSTFTFTTLLRAILSWASFTASPFISHPVTSLQISLQYIPIVPVPQ